MPACWKSKTTGMLLPPLSGLVRLSTTTLGCGPVRLTGAALAGRETEPPVNETLPAGVVAFSRVSELLPPL